MAISLLGLATSYKEKGDLTLALKNYHEAEEIAKAIGSDYQVKDAYEGLAITYALKKDFSKAYKYQTLLLGIKDKLFDLDIEKKLGTLQFRFDIDKKSSEIS
jgi:tetratricopeptide (TPR) repeat protein